MKMVIDIDLDVLLCGDIQFRIMNKGSFKNKLICRFAMNTSFIRDNVYEFTKKTVDPDSILKNPKFDDNFKIECYFKDYCQNCNSKMAIENLCNKCTSNMEEEISQWRIIRGILDSH